MSLGRVYKNVATCCKNQQLHSVVSFSGWTTKAPRHFHRENARENSNTISFEKFKEFVYPHSPRGVSAFKGGFRSGRGRLTVQWLLETSPGVRPVTLRETPTKKVTSQAEESRTREGAVQKWNLLELGGIFVNLTLNSLIFFLHKNQGYASIIACFH